MTSAIRHGEIILKPIAAIPTEATLEKESAKFIVGHSETGHHHVLEAVKPFKVFTWNGERYIEVPEIAELWHQKTGKDIHTPHKVAPGFYKVNVKVQYDYFKGALERVRD
jgi:hypothetical protein